MTSRPGCLFLPNRGGKRLYYVNNRAELVCLDTEGFLDGKNDGPFQDETRKGPTDADIIWKLDMMKELGVYSETWRIHPRYWGGSGFC